jgi:cysteine desulfurase
MNKRIYLDTAARTPIDKRVAKVMIDVQTKTFANAGSIHKEGMEAYEILETSRKRIANILGCHADELIFTSGGTESDNLAVFGVARAVKNCQENKQTGKDKKLRIAVSAIEHVAVLEAAKKLEEENFAIDYLSVGEDGIVDPKELAKVLTPQTILVSIMYANNELGTIQPIKEIAKVIRNWRKKNKTSYPYFHTDACQAGRFLDLSTNKLGVDLLSLSGSKIYGPHNVGLLYVKRGTLIEPIIYGGGQENGRRAGTEDVAAVAGLAEALRLCSLARETESKKLSRLRDFLINAVIKEIPTARLNGSVKARLPNNINFSFLGESGEQLVLRLDVKGFAVSSGAACSSRKKSNSYVIIATSGDKKRAESSVRITLGRETSKADIDKLIKTLSELLVKTK